MRQTRPRRPLGRAGGVYLQGGEGGRRLSGWYLQGGLEGRRWSGWVERKQQARVVVVEVEVLVEMVLANAPPQPVVLGVGAVVVCRWQGEVVVVVCMLWEEEVVACMWVGWWVVVVVVVCR